MSTSPPYRDRQYLAAIAGLLTDTGMFDDVVTSGLPEQFGQAAGSASLCALELDGFVEEKFADEPVDEFSYSRTVQYSLWILVRDGDPDTRDDLADQLAQVAANALVGQSYLGTCYFTYSKLGSGKYEPAKAPERRLRLRGEFCYGIDGRDARNAS